MKKLKLEYKKIEIIIFLNKHIAVMPYWIRVIAHVPCRQTFTPAASHLYITDLRIGNFPTKNIIIGSKHTASQPVAVLVHCVSHLLPIQTETK